MTSHDFISRHAATSRFGALVCLAILASAVAAGCGGASATPPVIYITPTPVPSGSATAAGTATPTAAVTAATPIPTTVPTPAPTPIVSSVLITSTAADGRWSVKFRKPVVSGIAPALATTINAAITAKMNSMITDFNGHELPIPEGGDPPSTMDTTFTVAYASPTLLSLRLFAEEDITGAAHPSHVAASINFKVQTGTVVALQDIFTNVATGLGTLSTQSRAMLIAMLGSDQVDMINGGTNPVITNFNSAWVCTLGGLELTFQDYSVGPYAEGHPTIVIPWATLAANIKPTGPAAEFLS